MWSTLQSAASTVSSKATAAASTVSFAVQQQATHAVAAAAAPFISEANVVREKVVLTASMWSGATVLSPSLRAQLEADGFTAEVGSGKYRKGGAVRVPWQLMSDVEGILTASIVRDAAGAAIIEMVIDSTAFPSFLRPVKYSAAGVYTVPIPTAGLKVFNALQIGFFLYIDISESTDVPLLFDVRVGGLFKLIIGVSLLPSSLTKPFPDPLVSILRHNFSAPVEHLASVADDIIATVAASSSSPLGTVGTTL